MKSMKKLYIYTLLLTMLLAGFSVSYAFQRTTGQTPRRQPPTRTNKPAPTPTPTQKTGPTSTATTNAQQVQATPLPPGGRARFDVTDYRIEAQLIPDQHFLRAAADVTFTPIDATRSVIFELNGSLKVDGIERNGVALTNFVQDAAGVDQIGPNVRVDLGEVVPAGQPITVRFHWHGWLT